MTAGIFILAYNDALAQRSSLGSGMSGHATPRTQKTWFRQPTQRVATQGVAMQRVVTQRVAAQEDEVISLPPPPTSAQSIYPNPSQNFPTTRPLGPTDAAPLPPSTNPPVARNPVYPNEAPMTIDQVSWTYQPPVPPRVFKVNDPVNIRVDEITRLIAEGSAESRKQTLFETIVTDWINIVKFNVRPDPQALGDPAVAFESDSNFRAESSIESREALTFNIAARVVDIRPNGLLVLEGRKSIRVNDNLWETSLTGLCRPADIAPDNVVLSKDLIDLEVGKLDRGHLRDGYSRGWLQKFLDRARPF